MTGDKAMHPTAHLVGSMPLDSSGETFARVSEALGPYLKRLPDGETGPRRIWVGYAGGILGRHPDFEPDPDAPKFQMRVLSGRVYREFTRLTFKPGVDRNAVTFETRYADIAAESFGEFARLQAVGTIPAGVRFQVSMPTPLALTYNYISPAARADFIRVYSDHMLDEVRRLAAMVPAEKLAIQWDVLQEVLMFEDYFGEQHPGYKDEVFGVLARIGDSVPERIELGYHYCYGSPLDEHLVQPGDLSTIVELMNGVSQRVRRRIDFCHIPVPRQSSEDAYFRPLDDLAEEACAELYLGLIHESDDAGNYRRLVAAQRHAAVAGVATECGLGRADPARVGPILDAYRTMLEHMTAARGASVQ